ncbi:hypothetical protein ANO11243_036200 [Dothideomycetidae sp. 11243]|nr:hypothetical protein ANO11243_036200 [fungal sp. No.11243]
MLHISILTATSPIFGAALERVPKNTASHVMLLELKMQYNMPDTFALDTWPVSNSMIYNASPEVAEQFMVTRSMPKAQVVVPFLEGVGGKTNLVVDDGPKWKTWRSAFNPGFANAHLMTLVPDIVDQVEIFRRKMDQYANDYRLFRMSIPVTRLTIDIIGKVVLDFNFNSQNGEHEMVSAFESAIEWMPLGILYRPSELWDFRRTYYKWRDTRIMNRFIDRQLVERWNTRNQRSKSKYVIDLAFETFLKDKGRAVKDELDPEFRRDAINQFKIFLFAGHDTSSTAICYCLYYFSKRPDVREKARKELDEISGTDADIAQMIRQQPTVLNKLPYLTAIIKEALRMHAPANSLRRGEKGFFLKDPTTGEMIPTEGMDILNSVGGNHYNKAWGDPFVFRPERWFEKTPDGAWVPFSKAPRSCIGQELAMIEIRIVCAIMFSRFDVDVCFDELGKLKNDGSSWPSDTEGLQTLWGVDMYQSLLMAKPRAGMPARVRRRQ